ncbi:MAG TPA: hypothetical protein VKM55_20265 [Candidatus Lokiarchaeia archaeon]|nr:hypothetical protein [Candidatus Lokiarchaeia archaeon]
MSLMEYLETLDLETEQDEILLVQAKDYTNWFLDTLDAMHLDWEFIEGCPWIQFEISSEKLRALMQAFSDVKYDLLE